MSDRADLRVFTHEPLRADVRAALRRIVGLSDVAAVAAMPDIHLAKGVCVGAVVATRSTLLPDAVGGDIGCGMAALRFDGCADLLDDARTAARLLGAIGERVPTASHRSADAALPPELTQRPLSAPSLERKKHTIGRVQLATLGRGNHFVEFQGDGGGTLWLMLHSGSRGMGQAIRDHHGGTDGALRLIAANSDAGRAYLSDLDWALDYARESRRSMCRAIAAAVHELTGAAPDWDSYIDCHHNFVRREDDALWVHRKGAISARDGEPGIIPGSMGSTSFHVTGRGNPASLCSSSHGAGRIMSRTEARRAISTRALTEQMRGIWFDHRLANRLRDEAPGAYKDIGAVMRAQRELTRIVRQLQPVLVYKGA